MMLRLLNSLPKKPQPVIVRYGMTTLIVGACFLLQRVVEARTQIFGFYLMYSAIFMAGSFFDRGSGFCATALSGALLLFTIKQHEGSVLPSEYALPVTLFLIIGLAVAAISEGLRNGWERAVAAEASKDVLLRELQHRTKNDLATAASVLSLQARSQSNPEVRAALLAAMARLQVLAKAHDQFEPVTGGKAVQMREYIEAICRQLTEAMSELCLVKVDVSCENFELPIQRAIPIGLIVNELVTNAYKHGFADHATGKVMVRLECGDRLTLTVEDNGKGSPKSATEGLGSKLIALLVKQLGGTSERSQGTPGCVVRIHIPESA
jgi:two-component system, sensor histidine kinase PdtaS